MEHIDPDYQAVILWLCRRGATTLSYVAWQEVMLDTHETATEPLNLKALLDALSHLSGFAAEEISSELVSGYLRDLPHENLRATNAAIAIARQLPQGIPVTHHKTDGVFSGILLDTLRKTA